MSRVEKSIKNLKWALLGQGIGVAISFISRVFFIKILGSDYLGLDGLFTNILTVLSLAELGVGEAITYSLYKPLAQNDTEKCKMLMQLYKRVYCVIGVVIMIFGISITPLLNFLIKDLPDIENISLIYILFVINTAISYFYSYKRNLIIANQNRYIATIYRYGFYFILNVFQIIFLVLTKSYLVFLILQGISTLFENIFISRKADKMYPYLKEKNKLNLDKETKGDIIKNTKAMMMHKVGGVVITSTDNIVLSSCISLTATGLYSNYSLIISALGMVYHQIFSSLMASIGNLCADSTKEKQYNIFKKINFFTYWIYSFSSICLIVLINPFIEMWLGKNYLLNMNVVLILVINFYITGMRKSSLAFREASGLFYKDRWKAIVEASINLISSIILAKKYGIIGVFLGTLISSLLTCVWIEPYILFKYGFEKKISIYFFDYIKKICLTVIIGLVVYTLGLFINRNLYFAFCVKLFICLVIPNVLLYLIFRNTEEFRYFYKTFLKKIIKISGNNSAHSIN